MKSKTALICSLLLLALAAVPEARAEKAADGLKTRLAALQANCLSFPGDPALREQVIRLALKAKSAVPEEARDLYTRANIALKDSKMVGDCDRAIEGYEHALALAPWFAEAYFNLSKAFELTRQYGDAAGALRFYLIASPHAKDAAAVGRKIKELADKETAEAREAQKNGLAESELISGIAREYGKGVAKDGAEAARLFKKAAAGGIAKAALELGYMYENGGRGVDPCDAEADRWFQKAADQGNAMAQLELGYMLLNGRGAAADPAQAMKWFRKAADQGQPRAEWFVGELYEEGKGVKQDDAEAAKWFLKAAAQDDLYALKSLVTVYEYGKGARQDFGKAVDTANLLGKHEDTLFLSYYDIASIHAYQGHESEAVEWLGKAIRGSWDFMEQAKKEKDFDKVRGSRAFQELEARLERSKKIIGPWSGKWRKTNQDCAAAKDQFGDGFFVDDGGDLFKDGKRIARIEGKRMIWPSDSCEDVWTLSEDGQSYAEHIKCNDGSKSDDVYVRCP